MGLKEKVIIGTSWNIISQITVQVISIAVTIVLARLLNPEDFGVVALSDVFFGFAYLFADLGMGAAIIRRQQIDDNYLSTSFWVCIITGLGLTLVLAAVSPLISDFYDKDILKYIIILSSSGFLLGSLTSVHTTILAKRLEFNKIAFINITSKVISGISSISIAVLGFGVWSLVLGGLVAQVFIIPLVWTVVKWRPRLTFSKKCFVDMFSFSSNLLAFSFFNYFARNFDNLLIGKVLGAQSLGYYALAYNVMLKPLAYISRSIGDVLFPALSSIQDDKARVRSVYLKVVRSISLITFPMMFGLVIVSKEFILTIYGPKWEPVILLLQLLCVVGAMQSIGTTVGTIFYSQGRSDLQLKWGVFASIMYILTFLLGIQWGLVGLILLYIAMGMILWPLSHYIANRLIGLDMKTFFQTMIPATIASLLMVLALSTLKYLNMMTIHLNIYFTLVILVILGIILYFFFLNVLFSVPEFEEVKSLLQQKAGGYIKPILKKYSVSLSGK
jgi:PST family polysaccharide transporter